MVGGAAVTEEMVPGFHFSRASYLAGDQSNLSMYIKINKKKCLFILGDLCNADRPRVHLAYRTVHLDRKQACVSRTKIIKKIRKPARWRVLLTSKRNNFHPNLVQIWPRRDWTCSSWSGGTWSEGPLLPRKWCPAFTSLALPTSQVTNHICPSVMHVVYALRENQTERVTASL